MEEDWEVADTVDVWAMDETEEVATETGEGMVAVDSEEEMVEEMVVVDLVVVLVVDLVGVDSVVDLVVD